MALEFECPVRNLRNKLNLPSCKNKCGGKPSAAVECYPSVEEDQFPIETGSLFVRTNLEKWYPPPNPSVEALLADAED
jgi:hypothetical protein